MEQLKKSEQTLKWYVVRAIGGKEKKAKEYIEGEVAKRNWSDLVPQVLIPTEKYVVVRNGKRTVKDRVFFPGYVLIQAVMLDEVKAVIQNLPNVIDFLGERDGTPTPMRQGEINRLLGVIDEQMDSGDSQEESFIVGEPVKVIDGPFNSFSGIVEGVNSEKKKLTVTVKIFGRKTPLELSFNQVEKE